MGSTIVDQDFPYDIIYRGKRDERKHAKKISDAVKKQLKDIISHQDIITTEKNKKVKVRLKYLDQFKFRFNKDHIDQIGRDEFDDLEEGEILSRPKSEGGQGRPVFASDDEGEDIYEAEFTLEELTDMMMEELELPDLDETKKSEIVSDVIEWTDRRKGSGIHALIDKKATIKANILRGAKISEDDSIINDDLRFRTWNTVTERYSNAVVFLMMDRSGSMWQDKIYAVKALYFWIIQFLQLKYDKVEIKFIAHDYYAKELKEKEFFSISDSGGTRVSAAYEMCRDMIKHNYPEDMWNIYCFHASDGDSWNDEAECMDMVHDMLNLGATMFAYTEINIDDYRGGKSRLLEMFEKDMIKEDRVLTSTVSDVSEIFNTLKIFLKQSVRARNWS